MGRLVPREDLASAVSVNGVVVNSAHVVGPALAGVLIVTVGTTACFGLNVLSYLPVIAALLAIRPRTSAAAAPPGRRGVKEGLIYAAGRQQLWLPLAMMAVVGLLAFNFGVVLPVLAKETFHGSGGTYGLLTTVLSVGAVLGSLAVGLSVIRVARISSSWHWVSASLWRRPPLPLTSQSPASRCSRPDLPGFVSSPCARRPSSCTVRARTGVASWRSGSSCISGRLQWGAS